MDSVLDGLRVLDLTTGPVGGLATTILADFGADVVKIEPPGGDRFRSLPGSSLWLRGKRSAVFDLAGKSGKSGKSEKSERRALRCALAATDVLVVGGPPSRALSWALDADSLAGEFPMLVHCAITPWGPRGPLAEVPGYEALVAARAGRCQTFARQLRGDAPGFPALPVAGHLATMGAVQGIVAALYARERSGRAQRVETSLLQGLLPYDLVELLLVQLALRGVIGPVDPSAGDMPTLNYHPVLAADGRWIQCGNLLEHLFLAFLDAIDLLGELLVEERFQAPPARWDAEAVEAARDRILLRVRERPANEWMEIFRANGGVAAEPFLTVDEALGHRDLLANAEIVESLLPGGAPVRTIGPIAKLHGTPGRAGARIPAVDEHGEAFRAETRPPIAAPKEVRHACDAGRPLAGIRVVDFSTIIAGPLATSMLADLGARVIKVESLAGDPYRRLLPKGILAVKTNAGKESIALDAKSEAGRAIVRDLVASADVVVHNFRTGVDERLGIDEPSCRALAPNVIWLATRGYGLLGSDAARPATHPVVGAAMSGAGFQAGEALTRPCETLEEMRESARQLTRANEANPDPNTSGVVAAAIMLGLLARERTGRGQRIDVSMLVANAWANADGFVDYAGKPERPQLDAELTGLAPGYRLYRSKDGWICLAVTDEAEWLRLAEAAACPELTDPAARTPECLAALFRTRTSGAWESILWPARVGCMRADGSAPGQAWLGDSQVEANGFVVDAKHARFGPMRRWGPIVTVGGPAARYGAGALCGDATDTILRELGRTPSEIRALRESGVVGSEAV